MTEETAVLILTRRCNLRCGYCPQDFRPSDMEAGTLTRALDALSPMLGTPARVKLFGGEPLLKPELAAKAVAWGRLRSGGARFELPTNGSLLDERTAAWLRLHPEVEVALSRPSPWLPFLPNVTYTFLLRPGEAPAAALRRFGEAVSAGARRFNFLPLYFVRWTAESLTGLRRTFSGLRGLLARLKPRGAPLAVENLRRHGSLPLFNDGIVVDTDGGIYGSNLILVWKGRSASALLRRGHVDALPALAPRPDDTTLDAAASKCFPHEILEQTARADAALTEFVRGLELAGAP